MFFFLGGVHVRTVFFPERYHSQTWQTKNPWWPCNQGTQHRNNPSARVPYLLGYGNTRRGHKTWRKPTCRVQTVKSGPPWPSVLVSLQTSRSSNLSKSPPETTNHQSHLQVNIHPSSITQSPKSGQFFPVIPTTWTFFRHFFWGVRGHPLTKKKHYFLQNGPLPVINEVITPHKWSKINGQLGWNKPC